MIDLIAASFYFILPAYIANMAPVLFKWVPCGGGPIDKGRSFRGERILGDHKTYRGVIAGWLCGLAVVLAQKYLVIAPASWALIDYTGLTLLQAFFLGSALGLGALMGDMVKSFFKRRLQRKPGSSWVPFDQLDFVIGALVLASFFYTPPLPHLLVILIITPLLHLLTNVVAYFLKLKKVWW